MKKIEEIRNEMLEKEILTATESSQIKGGAANSADDEKRRSRPGGGITTHRPAAPGR